MNVSRKRRFISFLLAFVILLSTINISDLKVMAAKRNEGTWFWPVTKSGTRIEDYAGCGGTGTCLLDGKSMKNHDGKNYSDGYHSTAATNHRGLDITSSNKKVFAANEGKVIFYKSLAYRGNTLIIEHPIANSKYSYYTLYQHLNSSKVSVGSNVSVGQEIAVMGNSDGGTKQGYGVHLHFEMFYLEKSYNFSSKGIPGNGLGFMERTGKSTGIVNVNTATIDGSSSVISGYGKASSAAHAGSITYTTDKNKVTKLGSVEHQTTKYNDPIGYLDVIESLCGGKIIHIAGWALDKDCPNDSIDIHTYVGDSAANRNAFAAVFKANIYRSDVNSTIGVSGNHGFDYFIYTNKTGIQDVYVYAINSGGGNNNPVIGNGHQRLTINTSSNHRWDSGKITKTSTCTSKGVKTYTCDICKLTKTEEIPETGHKAVTDTAVAATCTKAGKTAGSHCSVCGTVIKAQQTIKATGHSWDSGKITTKPTTTSTGIKTYTCTKCKTTKTETIPKLKQEKKAGVSYTTHIQSIGWQGVVRNGDLAGTVGDSKRLEAIKINLENAPYSGNIEYRTHVQTYGWQGWVKNGALSGTSGQAKRLEAIQIRLTGEMAKHYDVYYRIQVQSFGWLGWAKNGEYSGSAGYAKRLEAIQIVLVEKGKSIDRNVLNKQAKITSSTKVTNSTPYVAKAPSIHYQTHVQSIGWQGLKRNGDVSGVIGQSKRLEAIKIDLSKPPYDGGIRYKTHIQSIGWQGWKYDGTLSGTSGQSKRLEAICIELTGEMAKHYDVYYRVHAQSFGWLGWAKNGQNAGTAGYAKRLEGIQIVLVEKGQQGPGAKYKGIMADRTEAYISK